MPYLERFDHAAGTYSHHSGGGSGIASMGAATAELASLWGSSERIRCGRTGKQAEPDLAILDLGIPLMNGIEAAREISQRNPTLPLLLIGVQEMSDQLLEAARNAASRGRSPRARA